MFELAARTTNNFETLQQMVLKATAHSGDAL